MFTRLDTHLFIRWSFKKNLLIDDWKDEFIWIWFDVEHWTLKMFFVSTSTAALRELFSLSEKPFSLLIKLKFIHRLYSSWPWVTSCGKCLMQSQQLFFTAFCIVRDLSVWCVVKIRYHNHEIRLPTQKFQEFKAFSCRNQDFLAPNHSLSPEIFHLHHPHHVTNIHVACYFMSHPTHASKFASIFSLHPLCLSLTNTAPSSFTFWLH